MFLVGDTIKLRDGTITSIIGIDPKSNSVFPIKTLGGHCFTIKGKYHQSEEDHKLDIVNIIGKAYNGQEINLEGQSYVYYDNQFIKLERWGPNGKISETIQPKKFYQGDDNEFGYP